MTMIVKGVLVRDGKVLLAHRVPHRRNYPNTWSFPGGHVEDGETCEEALIRELSEEIGISAPQSEYLCDMQDDDKAVTFHLYVVADWVGEPRNLGDEHDNLQWFTLADAARLEGLTFDAYRGVFKQLETRV